MADTVRLGFLKVAEPKAGLFVGGLLVTGLRGRPLEFQCTTPVQPNPTQVTLYGPTLRPFILGELIGKTLLEKAAVKPHLILVDDPDALEIRPHVDVATGLVLSAASPPVELSDELLLEAGGVLLQFHRQFPPDRDRVAKIEFDEYIDLSEPLERVGDALRQTVPAAA